MVGARDRVHLDITGDAPAAVAAARTVPGVAEAGAADGKLDLIVDDARAALPRLLEGIARTGVRVNGVEVAEPNLETVFLHLTGKALRD